MKIKALANIEDLRTLVAHLIERVKLPVSERKKIPEISDDALRLILEKTNGNPRNVIHACREIFDHAISKGIEVADERIAREFLDSLNM